MLNLGSGSCSDRPSEYCSEGQHIPDNGKILVYRLRIRIESSLLVHFTSEECWGRLGDWVIGLLVLPFCGRYCAAKGVRFLLDNAFDQHLIEQLRRQCKCTFWLANMFYVIGKERLGCHLLFIHCPYANSVWSYY